MFHAFQPPLRHRFAEWGNKTLTLGARDLYASPNWRLLAVRTKVAPLSFAVCKEPLLAAIPASRRILIAVAGLVAIVAVAFAAMRMMGVMSSPPADLDLSRAKASEKGLYQVAIEPENGPLQMGVLHSWVLTLKTAAGQPVDDATIAVDGGMPEHGHGLPTSPAVSTHLGAGKYRVEGVKFTMSGWWELRLAIESAAGSDKATFNVVLK